MAKKRQTALQIHDKLLQIMQEHDATLKFIHSKELPTAEYRKLQDRIAIWAKRISDLRDVLASR